MMIYYIYKSLKPKNPPPNTSLTRREDDADGKFHLAQNPVPGHKLSASTALSYDLIGSRAALLDFAPKHINVQASGDSHAGDARLEEFDNSPARLGASMGFLVRPFSDDLDLVPLVLPRALPGPGIEVVEGDLVDPRPS